jgi:hypothetical protein
VDNELQRLLEHLKTLRRDLKAESVEQVAKGDLRRRAAELGSRWHQDFAPRLTSSSSLPADNLNRYCSGFTRLIKLSAPNNLRKSYLETLDALIRSFRDDLVIPAQQGTLAAPAQTAFDSFFSSLANPEESDYLREAVACARAGFYRAAVVLGWSAAIDRIHRKIETVGFAKFNVTSAQMASQRTGRFKKFNQVQNVNSLSELREVFDTVILWIVEGMGLIDSNQHTRLRSCFEMRCQGAHPGDAPITQFNLMSFFSDLDQIVLSNQQFTI